MLYVSIDVMHDVVPLSFSLHCQFSMIKTFSLCLDDNYSHLLHAFSKSNYMLQYQYFFSGLENEC